MNPEITSLHSPHVERVKALLGSRGKKIRNADHVFVADGMQSLRSAMRPHTEFAPRIQKIFVTFEGRAKLESEFAKEILDHDVVNVSDAVMSAMTETVSPQGVLALCKYLPHSLESIASAKKVAYFWQLQDPGNAGTAIRTADACGFDAVIFSDLSVDIYSPKVVRSTAGSLWNIPVVESIWLESFIEFASSKTLLAFDGNGSRSLNDIGHLDEFSLIFGNEARGLPNLPENVEIVSIPMKGYAESFNVASAAAIAMFHVTR
jgi:TrmH family RNA methyltransferase